MNRSAVLDKVFKDVGLAMLFLLVFSYIMLYSDEIIFFNMRIYVGALVFWMLGIILSVRIPKSFVVEAARYIFSSLILAIVAIDVVKFLFYLLKKNNKLYDYLSSTPSFLTIDASQSLCLSLLEFMMPIAILPVLLWVSYSVDEHYYESKYKQY